MVFLHSPASIALGNVGQKGGEKQDGAPEQAFSFRADRAQQAAPGSVHPLTGQPYTVRRAEKPAPIPDWLVDWLKSQKTRQVQKSATTNSGPILEGSRDNSLTSIGGRMRAAGLEADEIESALGRINQQRCQPPLPDSDITRIANSVSRYPIGADETLMLGSRNLADPSSVSAPSPVNATPDVSKWREKFRTVGELEDGDVRMLITDFLPEGNSFIGALSGHGKTLLGLSISKALTTMRPFLGKFPVKERVPVIYLIPESSGRAFKKRAKKFGIPDDPKLFLCRTISEGTTLLLDDPFLAEAVRVMKPLVILDTAIRFTKATDENAAIQNKQLNDDIISLRALGASVLGIHHSTKASSSERMTLENSLRGTGDIGAMCDAVYAIRRDEKLYDSRRGPNEIDVVCVKPRDFEPPHPFRIASSYKRGTDGQIVSAIDELGDFIFIEGASVDANKNQRLITMISEDPQIAVHALQEELRMTEWEVRTQAKKLGWIKTKGPKGHWTRLDSLAVSLEKTEVKNGQN